MLSPWQPTGALSLPPSRCNSRNKLPPDTQKSISQALSNTARSCFQLSIEIYLLIIITSCGAFAGPRMNECMSRRTAMRVPSRRPMMLSQSHCALLRSHAAIANRAVHFALFPPWFYSTNGRNEAVLVGNWKWGDTLSNETKVDVIAHVEPKRRVVEKILFFARIMAGFCSRRRYKLTLWPKYLLLGLDIWLPGRKIALLSKNDDFEKLIFFGQISGFQNQSPVK